MIDEKKITETVNAYISYPPEFDEGVSVRLRRDAFRAGVEWFKNRVWHDASEKPDREPCSIIIGYNDDYIGMNYCFENDPGLGTWDELFKRMNVIRWCYFSDILPKEGE